MLVDLHLHSLKSDGIYSPEEIVKIAYSNGIKTIALSDHDTSSGLIEAESFSKKLGLSFYKGIEFTAHITEDSYEHILGYNFFDLKDIDIYLKKLRYERIELISNYIYVLNNNGFNISFEEVKNLTPGEHLTIMHVAKWLNNNYPIYNGKDSYSLFIGTKGKYHIPEKCHYCTEIISLIHKAGGIAVLAHPFRYHPEFKEDLYTFENHVSFLKQIGLDGIEAYYGTHSKRDIQICNYIARKYQLIVTGGSDFHGWKDSVPMGIEVPDTIISNFLNS